MFTLSCYFCYGRFLVFQCKLKQNRKADFSKRIFLRFGWGGGGKDAMYAVCAGGELTSGGQVTRVETKIFVFLFCAKIFGFVKFFAKQNFAKSERIFAYFRFSQK
jgi:hypothetical protein